MGEENKNEKKMKDKHEKIMTQDGFKIPKGKKVRKGRKKEEKENKFSYRETGAQKKEALRPNKSDSFCSRIEKKKSKLNNSDFLKSFKGQSKSQSQSFQFLLTANIGILKDIHGQLLMDKVDRVICFGIGSIKDSEISQYQFCFLLILKDLFPESEFSLYEPILSSTEVELSKKFGVQAFDKEGKLEWDLTEHKTLFFLPHCEIELYEKLFASNWDEIKLEKMIFVGNSLESYCERNGNENMAKNFFHIFHLSKICFEKVFSNSEFIVSNVFNDICVHIFSFEGKQLPNMK